METASPANLENKIIEYYDAQGYQVTGKARLRGKSGIEHTFDLIAQRDDGFANCIIAFSIDNETERGARRRNIFAFANKAFDTGIRDRILISTSPVDDEMRDFAQSQRITTVAAEKVETQPATKPKHPISASKPHHFETKSQLLEALGELGDQTFEAE